MPTEQLWRVSRRGSRSRSESIGLKRYGRAEISTAPEHLEVLAINGKPPISVLKVTVEEAFLHCAKALIRVRLWEAGAQVDRSCYPTCGQVLADQIAGADAAEIDAGGGERPH